jgi:HSP20 family molecular chaperone IbpA
VIELSTDVDAERTRATYEDGILRIELPLAAQGERSHRVPIERSD